MASSGTGARSEKLSFAKIAAAGIKPLNAQQTPANNTHDHASPSSPPDASNIILPPTEIGPLEKAEPKELVEMVGAHLKESDETSSNGPRVHVQAADAISSPTKQPAGADGLLAPAEDDRATLVSSSDGDGKPPSLDGKSVASVTTFAMDEKESLRPDDSASIMAAAEDEDVFSAPGSGLPGSRIGSDDGVRAFRDQLAEISEMDPQRRGILQQGTTTPGSSSQGVLYVPPQGPGIGSVPTISRPTNVNSDQSDVTPDIKLLEALDNPRDRIWVLKLEQDVIDFVKDAKESSLNLPQCNSFYRMLAHKIADYYMLGHLVDDSNSAVRLFKTPSCRLPPPLTGVVTPSTAASTPPPTGLQMKILRRGIDPAGPAIANGSNMASKSASEYGESGTEDDQKSKAPITREEREARYEAARLRIMGSAKPQSPEAPKEKEDSRSSSAAGKKKTKKPRSNSDDGFEARSAYSSYFTPPLSATGYGASAYGFPAYVNPQGSPFAAGNFTGSSPSTFQQFNPQSANQAWGPPQFVPANTSQPWAQGRPQGYDMSSEFDRAMSLQTQQQIEQNQSQHSQYSSPYLPQPFPESTAWANQGYNTTAPALPTGYGASPNFANRPSSSASQTQGNQPYLFGQLPSQALGRPPNALEHPLPGSYKSPHFNPQSQAFVPGHTESGSFNTFAPQRPSPSFASNSSYGMNNPLERQLSAQSQGSAYSSPHQTPNTVNQPRMQTAPMTHPLPQPVFPRQPSPNVPLPPKPVTDQNKTSLHQMSGGNPQGQSSIAKWGTPASLPAKPPPSNEPFDPTRFAQTQRYNSAAAARMPGGVPNFGSMPMAGAVMNAGMTTGGKRM